MFKLATMWFPKVLLLLGLVDESRVPYFLAV